VNIRNQAIAAYITMSIAALLLPPHAAFSFWVMPGLNTYKTTTGGVSRVGELKTDGAWFITQNSDFTDLQWESIFDALGGIHTSEDNPDQNKSYVDYERIMGAPPFDSMSYNETGGLPGGTLLTDSQIDAMYASHGNRPILGMTRSYGGAWRTETDRVLENPKVEGITMEYVKEALLENINAPAQALNAIRASGKRAYVLLHAGASDGWTDAENIQIINNLNAWAPNAMASDEVVLVYQNYHGTEADWFAAAESVKSALIKATFMPNYSGVAYDPGPVITALTASASNEQFAPASLTVDASGMNPSDQHVPDWGTYWLANTSAGLTIEWAFDQIYELEKMQVWNAPDYWVRGMKDIKIEYSADDGANWTPLHETYTLAPRPDDGNWPHTTSFGYTDEISFLGVEADKVRFTALASGPNHTGDTTGLAEVRFFGDTNTPSPPADLALSFNNGVSIDRWYSSVPAAPNFQSSDIQLIKSMGFDHVKLLVNPVPHKSGNTINQSSMWYIDSIVNLVTNEGLPVVVTIHPDPAFKTLTLGNQTAFNEYLGFLEDFGSHLAARWSPDQLAFQLMTEPFGNTLGDWNTLQPQMWQAARTGMPNHTLVLTGDDAASVDGLALVEPVDDANVVYGFDFWEPLLFTHQGASWWPDWWPYLGNVPYPSSPSIVSDALPTILADIPDQWDAQVTDQLTAYGQEEWIRDEIDSRIQRVVDWNNSHGGELKLWIAEFGVHNESVDPADRYEFIQDLREIAEENDIGWAIWSYDETFTVLTPDHQPDQQMMQALGIQPPLAADFDDDGDVDGDDFMAWQRGFGTLIDAMKLDGDADSDGDVDADDLAIWEMTYGSTGLLIAFGASTAVPEPSSIALLGLAITVGSLFGNFRLLSISNPD